MPAPPIPAETLARLRADPEAWFAIERPTLVAGIERMCRLDEFCDGEYVLAARCSSGSPRTCGCTATTPTCAACADALAAAARTEGDELVEARAEAVLARLLHVRGRYADAVAKYRWCAERLARQDDRRTGGGC